MGTSLINIIMKYSISTILSVIAAVAVSSVDARKSDKAYIGDCSALSFSDFTITTEWEIDPGILYTYPCSGGYATNFASNDQLLKDVRKAINRAGYALGIKADCANLCDVDNKSYVLVGDDTPDEVITGRVSVAAVYPPEIANIFCDPVDGVLNNFNPNRDDAFDNGPNGDLNACRCDPENEKGGGKYISGCYECEGALRFKVKSCLDSSGFKSSTPIRSKKGKSWKSDKGHFGRV